MSTIHFIRTAARAEAYGHVIIVREDPSGEKPWSWQIFPIGGDNGERAHGSSASEGGARSAAKKRLFQIPVVAEHLKRERVVHWNGEQLHAGSTGVYNYASAPRACGAKEGYSTNGGVFLHPIDCPACLALVAAQKNDTEAAHG